MLIARDYNNNEYPLLANKVVSSELNGNEDLELLIPQQKNNNLDLLSIDKLWEFDYNNIIYKAVNVKRQTRGNSFNLNVRAMPLFYWEFSKSIIHENHDGSHTANSAFRTVFDGTGFNFVLVDFSPSVEIEGFGKGSNRLELFKRLLDRYNYEFEIQGRTVYMKHLIGNDTNFMYKYKLNASNVSSTTDATEYFTHIKGFGNFEEGEEDYFNNAKLKREYTHPLADVVGKWEGPPVVDGRVKDVETLQQSMYMAVEESLEISIEGTLHDIRKMGYNIAVPQKGDRVWLHDERINLEKEIRLNKIVTTYDEKDNIIDCEVTFGSQSIRDRYKASINSLSKRFSDLLLGKLKLPVISLEQIGMDMINAIHAASSEIIFGDFGMQAISKTNPNNVFGVNSEGWYISQDGGRTPKTIATAQGIYADALFAGTLWLTSEMNIESLDGYLNMTGSNFRMASKTGNDRYVDISPDGAKFMGGMIEIMTSSDDRYVRLNRNGLFVNKGSIQIKREDAYVENGKQYGLYMQNGIPKLNMNAQRNQFMHYDVVSWTGQRYQMSGENMSSNQTYNMETVYNTHDYKFMTVGFGSIVTGTVSAYVLFEIVEIGGGVVASSRRFVRSGETDWGSVTVNVGVPDYSTGKAYYLRAGLETVYMASRLQVVINRVSMHG